MHGSTFADLVCTYADLVGVLIRTQSSLAAWACAGHTSEVLHAKRSFGLCTLARAEAMAAAEEGITTARAEVQRERKALDAREERSRHAAAAEGAQLSAMKVSACEQH